MRRSFPLALGSGGSILSGQADYSVGPATSPMSRVGVGSTLLLAAAMWPSWAGLWTVWWTRDSHGFVIAGLTLWLVWRERGTFFGASGGMAVTVPVLWLASVVWFVCVALNIQAGHQLLAPLILALWVTTLGGRAAARAAVPIAATFLLAVPVWGVLSGPLQRLTILANQVVLSLAGPNATVRGRTITIPSGTFLVEGGCSGLNYFMAALVLGVVAGHLLLQKWSHRWAVLIAAATLAVLGNWIRVYGLIVIGHWTEMQSPLMVDHIGYGWLVFAVLMVPFFVLTARLEERDRAERARAEGMTPIRLWVSEAEGEADRVGPTGTTGLVGGFGFLGGLLGPVLYLVLVVAPGPAPVRESPTPAGAISRGWTLAAPVDADVPSGTWLPDFSGFDSVEVTTWRQADEGPSIMRYRLVYRTQDQGKELVNDLNRIAPARALVAERIRGPLPPDGRRVSEALVRQGDELFLVWYWYHVGGQDTPHGSIAKARELLALLQDAPASELVAVRSRCAPADCSDAGRALASLVLGVDVSEPSEQGG